MIVLKTVQNVEQWAFMDCDSITSITFLNSMTVITWPSITNRKDKKKIEIRAEKGSSAEKYCDNMGRNIYYILKEFDGIKEDEKYIVATNFLILS